MCAAYLWHILKQERFVSGTGQYLQYLLLILQFGLEGYKEQGICGVKCNDLLIESDENPVNRKTLARKKKSMP